MTSERNQQTVYQIVKKIPPGCVATYGQVADLSNAPGRARWIGYLLRQLPPEEKLPWHRVVNAKGRISFPKGSEKHAMQRRLLEEEGVVFTRGVIDLKQFQWTFSLPDWLFAPPPE